MEAIEAAAGAMNRYPDPDATLLRRRLAERYETEPGRIAVGNGSCEILLAAAEALCEPGAEIVYAWPSFSMYPHLAALTGAREIRVPLGEGEVHDLDAMATEVTAATQLAIVCNPNNPTATHLPASEVAAFCERIPSHVTIALDEAYVEFQTDDDPDATLDLLAEFPNLVLLRTFSKSTAWPGCGSASRSARPSSAPRSTRCASRSASTPSPRRPPPRRSCTRTTSCAASSRTIAERTRVEEGLRELGLATAETQTNFSWIDLGEADERRGRRRPRRALDRGPPGHPARRLRPHPGQLRHPGRGRPLPCRDRRAAGLKRPERPPRRKVGLRWAAPFQSYRTYGTAIMDI